MFKITLPLFVFCTALITAQEPTVSYTDFNLDGIEDRLACIRDNGSSFGSEDCTVTDAMTGEIFKLSNHGSFGEIKQCITVSAALGQSENASFLNGLRKEMLPPIIKRPDASLEWIIASTYHRTKPEDDSFYELFFTPNTVWKNGSPKFPETYTLEMHTDSLQHIFISNEDGFHEDKAAFGYLAYYGDNHLIKNLEIDAPQEFVPAIANETYEVQKTAHGVVAKKGDTYKWLFVTDANSNSAVQKLRWPSIEEVMLYKEYAVIRQNLAPNPEYALYIVNIETRKDSLLKTIPFK